MLFLFFIFTFHAWNVKGLNIALNKATRQKSDLEPVNYESYLANDGSTKQLNAPLVQYGVCAHTQNSANEWWVVNVGDSFNIFNIEIYGRMDNYYTRFKDFDVDVIKPQSRRCPLTFSNIDQGIISFSFYVKDPVKYINITCTSNTFGQFIRIRNRGAEFLTLCEVEVYGELATESVEKASYQGFPGKIYNGNTITSLSVSSSVQCTVLCRQTSCCYAASFNSKSKMCELREKASVINSEFLQNSEWNAYTFSVELFK